MPCWSCKGKKVDAYKKTCEVCEGSGYMSDYFKVQLEKTVKEVTDAMVPRQILKYSQVLSQSQMNFNQMPEDDDMDDGHFDKNAELRRQHEQARQLLLSRPVNMPKAERQIKDVQMICETPKPRFTVLAGERFQKTFSFKNTSQLDINEPSILRRVDGDQIHFQT